MTRRRPRPFLLPLLPALFFSGAQTSRTTSEPARPIPRAKELPIEPWEIENRWKPAKP